jgi:type IV pilus assembly protein PilA
MLCPDCRNQVSEPSRFCFKCGASLESRLIPASKPFPRRAVIAIVAISVLLIGSMVVLAIAIPRMVVQTNVHHELTAITSIGAIHRAQAQYYAEFGHFAPTLAPLGPPANGEPGKTAADLIPADLATGRLDGYMFFVTGTVRGYAITAAPEQFGVTGRRTFYSDQTLVIRNNWNGGAATAESPELQ